MSLSNILKSLRASRGYTQGEMALKLGISKNAYNRKELGLREFTLSEAKKISDIFQCKIDDIFFVKQGNTNDTQVRSEDNLGTRSN